MLPLGAAIETTVACYQIVLVLLSTTSVASVEPLVATYPYLWQAIHQWPAIICNTLEVEGGVEGVGKEASANAVHCLPSGLVVHVLFLVLVHLYVNVQVYFREGFVGKKGLSQQNAACHLDPSFI